MKDIPRLNEKERLAAAVKAQETAERILEHFVVAMRAWDDCQSKEVMPHVARELVALAQTCQRKLSRMLRDLTWSDV